MYRRTKNSASLVALLAMMAVASAAQAGEIRGRVVDGASNSTLPGARISIEGSSLSAVSASDGSFTIPGVAPGSYRLIVEYVGYPDDAEPVTVNDGEPARVQIAMSNAELVTVTGTRQAERMALQRKRSTDNLIETLNSNDVGKLPDQNVAEAVRRMPGLSVANDQGEGRYVIIRGAPPSLANVTINGNTAAAPEPDSRQVKLDDIPASLVGSLTVVKSLTPDLDANAIAGAVNISTLSAFDRKDSFIYARAAAGHYDLSGKSPYEMDLTMGSQFGANDEFGVVLSGNYSTRPIVSENFGAGGPSWVSVNGHVIPSNFQIRDYSLTRERAGAVGNFDWHPYDNLKLFVRTTYSSFGDNEIRDRFTVTLPAPNAAGTSASYVNQTATTGSFTTGGRAMRYVRAREEDDHTLSLSSGGNMVLGENIFDLEGTFSEAAKIDPRRDEWTFRTGTTISGTYDLSQPLYSVTPDANAYDPTKFAFQQLVHAHRAALEHLYQIHGDWERPIPFGDNSSIKAGFKYLDREKKNDQEQQTFGVSGTNPMTLANVAYTTAKTATYDGRFPVGPRVSYGGAEAYFATNHGSQACDSSAAGGFKCDVNGGIAASNSADYAISESVTAGYVMATLKFGALTLIPGVRLEDTDGTYSAKVISTTAASPTPVVTPVAQGRHYTDWFPGLNARYDLTDDLVLRAAVTTAIGRPDYNNLPPFATVDTTATPNAVSTGNPNLKPLHSTNLDLVAEYYLPGQGIASISLFHKDISDPIFTQSLLNQTGTFGGIAVTGGTVSTFANARSGRVQGVEFNLQTQFDFLPSPFDGLGASANLSLIDSRAAGVPGRADTVPLFQQSKTIGTAQVYYEKYGMNLRLAYSYRSKYLLTVGGSTASDVYVMALGSLDARAAYDITSHLQVFVEASNLTDAPYRTYIGNPSQIFENERYSWSGKTGLQIKF